MGYASVRLNRDEFAKRKLGPSVYVFLGPQPLCCFHKDTEQLQAAELAGMKDLGGQTWIKRPKEQPTLFTLKKVMIACGVTPQL